MPSRSSRLGRPGSRLRRRRRRLSSLYCAVAGDLCDRSVSVCSLRIPASNNHSEPVPPPVRQPIPSPRPSASPRRIGARPGRETRRGGTRARPRKIGPVATVADPSGGISIRSIPPVGGEEGRGKGEGEGVDDRRGDPPRQIEINFTRITRRAAYIRFARILLSSQPIFIACCFRRLILGFESRFESRLIEVVVFRGMDVSSGAMWGKSVVVAYFV